MSEIMIQNARLSFPALYVPSAYPGSEPKYNAVFMLHKETHAAVIKELAELDKKLADAKYGKTIPKKLFHSLQDGDKEDREEYENHYILKAKNKRRPIIVDRDKSPLVEEDGRPMGGDYVNGRVRLYAWNNDTFHGILCELQVVQFVKEGERFGAGSSGDGLDYFTDISQESAADAQEEVEELYV